MVLQVELLIGRFLLIKSNFYSNSWLIMLIGLLGIPFLASLSSFFLMVQILYNKDRYYIEKFKVEKPYFTKYRSTNDWGLLGKIKGIQQKFSLTKVMPTVTNISILEQDYFINQEINVLYYGRAISLETSVLPENYDFNKVKVKVLQYIFFIYLLPIALILLACYSYYLHKAELKRLGK